MDDITTSNMELLEKYPENEVINTLILAAHTDSRSYAAYDLLAKKNTKFDRVIVFDYENNRPTTDSDQYEEYYRLKSLQNARYIPCSSYEADCEYIGKMLFASDEKVLVDITSISIPDIFRLFFVLKEMKGIIQYEVVYSEPKYYDYLNGLYFDYDRETGQKDYRVIPEYFTSAISRNVELVCFIGFERLVSKYIHERKEHSGVTIINGFPAFLPKIKDISIEHNYELISTIGMDRIHYSQANDPFSAYNTLCTIKNSVEGVLLDICVLGSKPMALGACIFALTHHDDTKVSFPFPKSVQKHASIKVADIWWYKIKI